MAEQYSKCASLALNLNRQQYGPLDVSDTFFSRDDLYYYVSEGKENSKYPYNKELVSDFWKDIVPYPYPGQLIRLVETTDNTQTVGFYYITRSSDGYVLNVLSTATVQIVPKEGSMIEVENRDGNFIIGSKPYISGTGTTIDESNKINNTGVLDITSGVEPGMVQISKFDPETSSTKQDSFKINGFRNITCGTKSTDELNEADYSDGDIYIQLVE